MVVTVWGHSLRNSVNNDVTIFGIKQLCITCNFAKIEMSIVWDFHLNSRLRLKTKPSDLKPDPWPLTRPERVL